MASAASLKVDFLGDLGDLTKKFQSATSQMEQFANRMNRIGKQMSVALTAPITAFGATSVRAFAKQEDAERKLSAAIRATGGDVDRNMARFSAFASEMQRLTVVGDETTLGLLQLATAQGLSADSAERAVKNAISMQSAFGVGAESAIRMTAALEQGDATMLRRYIPALRGVEDSTEAVARAHEILSGAFSIAQEEALTTSGQIAQLRNAFGDFQEQVGAVIAKSLTPFVERAKSVVESLQAMDKEVLALNVKYVGLAAAIGPVLIGIAKLTGAIRVLTVAMMANPALALATVIGTVLVGALVKFQYEAAKSEIRINRINEGLEAQKTGVDDLVKSYKDLERIEAIRNLQSEIREQQLFINALREQRDAIKDVEHAVASSLPSQAGMLGALSAQSVVVKTNNDELEKYNDKIATATNRLHEMARALAGMVANNRAVQDTTESVAELADQIERASIQALRFQSGFDDEQLARYNNSLSAMGNRLRTVAVEAGEIPLTLTAFEKALIDLDSIGMTFVNSFGSGMANIVVQSEKLVDVLSNMGRLLASAAIQKFMTVFLTGGLELGGTGFFGEGGGAFGFLRGLFGRSTGGQVGRNTPYLVGERGPELFIPGASGFIASNNAISGGSGAMQITGTFRVAGTDLIATIENAKRIYR